eukprot:6186411-Pleurochrysis_carterae.AAC.4
MVGTAVEVVTGEPIVSAVMVVSTVIGMDLTTCKFGTSSRPQSTLARAHCDCLGSVRLPRVCGRPGVGARAFGEVPHAP